MARGVNKVILVGNLGKDPETRYFPDGGAITNATLATSESWKDRTTGEPQERTEWHKITFRGRLAEIAGEYLRKGSKIYVEGKLATRKWQDQQGNDRYTTEVQALELQMLDSRNGPDQGQDASKPASQHQGNQQPAPSYQPKSQPSAMAESIGFDDDIPF